MIGVASQTTCTRKAFAAQGKNGRCNTVAKAAAAEVATVKKGPMLEKKYHGPHSVAEDGIERIVSMLRKGDLFRYGGQDEGSLQVCVCLPSAFNLAQAPKHCEDLPLHTTYGIPADENEEQRPKTFICASCCVDCVYVQDLGRSTIVAGSPDHR